ncbi:MAG TPA: SUMF1/EgtB/PvdO family nonheme iron enzyme [Chthoniobacteraceae bacterium]|nr:SUMF1/EgtB/PvdO family nonheme iron enzyme [Chthoniobacteraceae bacterium]
MLPNPLPDNPQRWDGWRKYNSEDFYERLCLSFDANPADEQIEDNCRQLLVWWQKKLPLKNQPSNPVAQMLRGGMDEAPALLAEARTRLLDPVSRAEIDAGQRARIVEEATNEFRRIIPFFISNSGVTEDAERRLYEEGGKLGLMQEEMERVLNAELERVGAKRVEAAPAPAPAASAPFSATPVEGEIRAGDPFSEFRRVLKLSKLCLDGEEMTDDQRDALCNMGESLGLTGGQAEDVIDEYLEEIEGLPQAAPVKQVRGVLAPVPAARPLAVDPNAKGAPAKPAPKSAVPAPVAAAPKQLASQVAPVVNTSPVARLHERNRYPNFTDEVGSEMILVPSGVFLMGSDSRDVAPHEQPAVQTTIGCFYMARFPVTNQQYEKFDPRHAIRRAPWADDSHPVIYVSSKDAIAFCEWLSKREGRKYRLPTEAEWEYAARGTDNRVFPWGDRLDSGQLANFADKRTNFPWSDATIDDGYAETAPVGKYPRGASPFGIEDLAGNVNEWCLDFFDFYRGQARVNPKGPANGTKRVYRGGSWRSRSTSLRASARAFNTTDYVANDLGFRVVCECE